MNYKLYLQRIAAGNTDLSVNTETLFYLQRQHLLHVPFENIDINSGIPITLDSWAFFDKIVTRRRGGYCYECNGLFYELLRELGFNVRMISCRVAQRKNIGPEYDHLALIVVLEEREWLVDVGFGDFSMQPLSLNNSARQHDGRNNYCIEHYGSLDGLQYFTASKWNDRKRLFAPVYLFTTCGHSLGEFAEMNRYHQTSPESHFTKSLICSIPTAGGRISLINNRIILTSAGGHKEEKLLYGATAMEQAFAQYFGMADTLSVPAF